MTNAMCSMLASLIDGRVLRCPTTPTTFHYHALDSKGKRTAIDVWKRMCDHRHKNAAAAAACK